MSKRKEVDKEKEKSALIGYIQNLATKIMLARSFVRHHVSIQQNNECFNRAKFLNLRKLNLLWHHQCSKHVRYTFFFSLEGVDG